MTTLEINGLQQIHCRPVIGTPAAGRPLHCARNMMALVCTAACLQRKGVTQILTPLVSFIKSADTIASNKTAAQTQKAL